MNVGTDIIEVARIEKIIKEKGDKFLNRIYTKYEINYCESKGLNKYQHYAGRFAAKEAIFKAIDVWYDKDYEASLKLKEIEIRGFGGVPAIGAMRYPVKFKAPLPIYVSISHTKEYATATAIATNANVDYAYIEGDWGDGVEK